jgi:hypothetical protein
MRLMEARVISTSTSLGSSKKIERPRQTEPRSPLSPIARDQFCIIIAQAEKMGDRAKIAAQNIPVDQCHSEWAEFNCHGRRLG